MSVVKRYRFHLSRFRGDILYASVIIAVLMLMIGLAFPKDADAIAGYIDILTGAGLDALLASVDVNAPGWLFWVSLMAVAYIYIVSVIAAIRIGSRLYPTNERSALELIASSPKQAQSYYLENIIAAIIALLIIFFPGFLVLAVYSITENSPDSIPRIAIMFLLQMVVCLFYIAIVSLPSILRFSEGTGTKLGYLYLFLGFLIELGAGSVEGYGELANLSINSYVSPSAGLLSGDHNWLEGVVVLLLAVLLFALSFYLTKIPDYIEKVSATRKNRFNFLPQFSPKGTLASRYPLLFDQFRKDRAFFFVWAFAVNFAFVYIILIYFAALKDNPQILTDLTSSFGGFLDIFTFGYETPPTFVGFLTFEVFGIFWLYFGLFVFIPAINIANRDQQRDEQDLIWSNSVTTTEVITNRTAGLIIYFTVYFWLSYVSLWGFSTLFGLELEVFTLFSVFIVGYIHFVGMIFLFVGITMIFPIRQGKKVALWFYIISILLLITSFLEPSLEIIHYASVAYYYDPVGLVLERIDVSTQLLNAFILLIVSVILYLYTLNRRYSTQDLLS